MEKTIESCVFCDSKELYLRSDVGVKLDHTINYDYICPVCGHVWLKLQLPERNTLGALSEEQKRSIGTYIRNEYGRNKCEFFERPFEWKNLDSILNMNVSMDPVERMDKALLNLERESHDIGSEVTVNNSDYYYYNCSNLREMVGLFLLLYDELL